MPIYEYECGACGLRKDFIQKMSDDPLTDCPQCGESALKKRVSAAAFRLKGGGWYETDFKQGDKKNIASGDDKSDKPKSSQSAASDKASSSAGAASAGQKSQPGDKN